MLSNNLKPHNMKIDDQFILDLKAAHSTYEQFLDKKKQKNSNPELNVEKEAEEARKEQLVQTETDSAVLHEGISAAEDLIAAGSEEIQVLVCKKKKVDSATLAKSHAKISMGLKRKAELLNEVELVKQKEKFRALCFFPHFSIYYIPYTIYHIQYNRFELKLNIANGIACPK